jgi:hypothetical protein
MVWLLAAILFFPSPQCVFNNGCMSDIIEFIKGLMDERKRVKKDKAG